MASEIIVNTIKAPTTGANANKVIIPSGVTLAAPGHIIQTVSNTYTARFSTTSTSYVEVTGLTTSITPASTSSKILVQINTTYSINGHGGLQVYRSQGGTNTLLSVGDANGNQSREVAHNYLASGTTSYGSDSAAITILDTPATTSAVSYKLFAGVPYSATYTLTVNYQFSEANTSYAAGTISTMTLMEIGG